MSMATRLKPTTAVEPADDDVDDAEPAVADRHAAAARADAVAGRVKNARGRRTKQKLIDAAIRCFSDYGYRRTRIQDIVFQAGVSQGSFYRHFTTKSELLLEALEPCLEELLTVTSGAGGGGGGGAPNLEAMMQVTSAYFTSYARNRLLLRLLREAAVIDAEFYERWQRQRQRFIGRTERWMERLYAAGHIGEGNFPILADVLGSTVEQTCYVHIGLPEQAPRQERIQELARTVAEVWFRSLPPPAPAT
jgi:AcrR family transcriptional regulator